MTQEQKDFLSLFRLKGVLSREEAAWFTGFTPVEIDILSNARKLTPLGKPKKNAKKVFATIELERCLKDMDWLNRAQSAIQLYWEMKNRSRRS